MAKSSRKRTPDGEKEDSSVKVAKVGLWQAVLVSLITAVGGGLGVYFTVNARSGSPSGEAKPVVVVPFQNTNVVRKLPEESNAALYDLFKDISIFDLRQWKPTPDSLKNTRHSPANYINYLHLKKSRPLDKIVIHYATTGFAIDMRCITNSFDFYQQQNPTVHNGQVWKEYALVIDVSSMPLDREFLIVVEATYWNGFRNLQSEDAATYTDAEANELDELGLIVFFPEAKPFTNYQFLDKPENGMEDSYRGVQSFYADINRKYIYWSVKDRQPSHHYKLKWNW